MKTNLENNSGACNGRPSPFSLTIPVRVVAAIMTLSGAIFVPLAWYPILTPGLVIWIGWLLIAIGYVRFNIPLFWYCSMGFNCWIVAFILWLRNGEFGPLEWPIAFVWTHLGIAIFGSAIVLYSLIMSRTESRDEDAGLR